MPSALTNASALPPVRIDDAASEFRPVVLPKNGFLIERNQGLGDLIMLLSVLRGLQRMGYYVCLLCDAPYIPFMTTQGIDLVLDIDERPWPESRLIADLRRKVDYPQETDDFATVHRTLLFARALKAVTSVEVPLDEPAPHLKVPAAAEPWAVENRPKEPYAVAQMRASSNPRSYPHMYEVCRRLQRHLPVIAIHHEPVPLPPGVIDHCGHTSVANVAALIAGASVVVAPDSSGVHLAGGYGVPFVALFGPTLASTRLDYYQHFRVLRSRPQCEPCHEQRHCVQDWNTPSPCLSEVPPEHVVQAANHKGRNVLVGVHDPGPPVGVIGKSGGVAQRIHCRHDTSQRLGLRGRYISGRVRDRDSPARRVVCIAGTAPERVGDLG